MYQQLIHQFQYQHEAKTSSISIWYHEAQIEYDKCKCVSYN